MIEGEQGRVSVWEYLNPVSLTTFAYTNPLGNAVFGTYRTMAAGRGMMIPGIVPQGLFGARPITSVALKESFKAGGVMPMLRTGGKSLIFGIEGLGAADATSMTSTKALANSMVRNPLSPISSFRRGNRSAARNLLRQSRSAGIQMEGSISREIAKGILTRPTAQMIGRAGIIAAGRVINPIMNIVLVAQVAKFLGESAFRGIQATADVIDRATEKVYNLELGGDLSRGFLTTQAATERQRALQAIQSSHLSARRFLGSEASVMH